jgi:hypothetical protein
LASKFEEVLLRAQKIFQIQSRVLKNAEFYADFKTVEKIAKKFPEKNSCPATTWIGARGYG